MRFVASCRKAKWDVFLVEDSYLNNHTRVNAPLNLDIFMNGFFTLRWICPKFLSHFVAQTLFYHQHITDHASQV